MIFISHHVFLNPSNLKFLYLRLGLYAWRWRIFIYSNIIQKVVRPIVKKKKESTLQFYYVLGIVTSAYIYIYMSRTGMALFILFSHREMTISLYTDSKGSRMGKNFWVELEFELSSGKTWRQKRKKEKKGFNYIII